MSYVKKQCGRDRCLELVEEGLIDRDALIMMFVKWSTGDDIVEMFDANQFPLLEGDRWDDNPNEDEDEDDNEHPEACDDGACWCHNEDDNPNEESDDDI